MKDWKEVFKPRILLPGLALIFVFLYTLFVLTGGDIPVQGRRNSFNRGDSGYFLFYRLFKDLGYNLIRWYEATPPDKPGLMIYFDYLNEDKDLLDGVLKWVRRGNMLVLAGIQSKRDPVFSRPLGFGPARKVDSMLDDSNFAFSWSRYLEAEPKDEVLLSSESGALCIMKGYGEGMVFLFPDNNIFINRYFRDPAHAVHLNYFFSESFGTRIYLYEYGTGVHKVGNPVMILFKGNMLYLTLHLILMGLIFAAWRIRRFGKPVRLEPYKRRSLSVHLAAVGNFYQKTRALDIVDSLLRKYLIYRARHLLNLGTGTSPTELAEKIADYTGWNPEKLRVVFQETGGENEKMLHIKRREMFALLEEIKEYKRNKRFRIKR